MYCTMDSKQVGNSMFGKWLKAEQGERIYKGQKVWKGKQVWVENKPIKMTKSVNREAQFIIWYMDTRIPLPHDKHFCWT